MMMIDSRSRIIYLQFYIGLPNNNYDGDDGNEYAKKIDDCDDDDCDCDCDCEDCDCAD